MSELVKASRGLSRVKKLVGKLVFICARGMRGGLKAGLMGGGLDDIDGLARRVWGWGVTRAFSISRTMYPVLLFSMKVMTEPACHSWLVWAGRRLRGDAPARNTRYCNATTFAARSPWRRRGLL